jgi:hypothetical protein
MSPRGRFVLAALLAAAAGGCETCSGGKSNGGSSSGGASTSDASAADAATVVNATVLPAASVEAVVNPEKLAPYDGPTGSVEGTITVVGDPPLPTPSDFSGCPAAEAIWGKSYREGAPTGAGHALPDAIVAVTGYHGFVPAKGESVQIDIEGCGYTSRTAVLTFGQRLEVKNHSKEFWTPMLQPGPTMVMMMASPNADPVRLYPKKPGRYLVVDRDRRYVDVDVYVLLQPLAAVTDVAGHYRIDGIPTGKVTVSTTHPRFFGDAHSDIDIKAGLIQRVDLVLRHVSRDAGPPPVEDSGYHPTLH